LNDYRLGVVCIGDARSSQSGLPVPVIAGVFVAIVVVAAIIVVVVVIFIRRRRGLVKTKKLKLFIPNSRWLYLFNPLYSESRCELFVVTVVAYKN